MSESAQHFLQCVLCDENAELHCNTCGDILCVKCKDKHLRSNASKNHNVVLYIHKSTQRRISSAEKCLTHPTYEYEACCQPCGVPVCIGCIKDKHQGHTIENTDDVYQSTKNKVIAEVARIKNEVIPLCQKMLGDIKADTIKCTKEISGIREIMTMKAKTIKDVVDEILSDNMEVLDNLQKVLESELLSQDKCVNQHIQGMEETIDNYKKELKSSKKTGLIFLYRNTEKPQELGLSEITFPSFIEGDVNKGTLAEMIGKTFMPSSNNRTDRKRDVNLVDSLTLSSTATFVRSFDVSSLTEPCYHMTFTNRGHVWLSDFRGNLILADSEGQELFRTKTSDGQGYHTETEEGELLYTDKQKKCIKKITSGPSPKIKSFISTGNWEPLGIYSSKLNGDILVAQLKESANIVRYNKKGKEISHFSLHDISRPVYITENINGDVIVSDSHKVMAVNAKGKQLFIYSPGSHFRPWSIDTDILGHILVCDVNDYTVHILDKKGEFLANLRTTESRISDVTSLGIDNEHNVWITSGSLGKILVYKYLH